MKTSFREICTRWHHFCRKQIYICIDVFVHAGMSTMKGLEKSTTNLYKTGPNEMAMGVEDDNFFIIYLGTV